MKTEEAWTRFYDQQCEPMDDNWQQTALIGSLERILRMPEVDHVQVANMLSSGQCRSKTSVVEIMKQLEMFYGTVYIVGGWYGSLAFMMWNADVPYNKIRSFDIDPSCAPIAEAMNQSMLEDEWTFKATTKDMFDINYDTHEYITVDGYTGNEVTLCESPDTIINTSCEHIEFFDDWYDLIPAGKLVILQSNNFDSLAEHVNCVYSLKQFAEQSPMEVPYFAMEEDMGEYVRYTRMGIK